MNDTQINHEIKLVNRNNIFISGVKKIIKFDKNEFVIDSIQGVIVINGDNLELLSLDNQNMTSKIKGLVYNFNYTDKLKKQESFITKLFK